MNRTITATQFKAKCLRLMDEVNETGEPLTITKNGKPVAIITPAVRKRPRAFGRRRGEIEIAGDIMQPVWTEPKVFGLERETSEAND